MKKLKLIKLSSDKLKNLGGFEMKSLYGGGNDSWTLPEVTVYPDRPNETDGPEELQYDGSDSY